MNANSIMSRVVTVNLSTFPVFFSGTVRCRERSQCVNFILCIELLLRIIMILLLFKLEAPHAPAIILREDCT